MNAASELIVELGEGKWAHLERKIRTKPLPKIRELIAELEKRSPGHTKEAYEDAIARAYWQNR